MGFLDRLSKMISRRIRLTFPLQGYCRHVHSHFIRNLPVSSAPPSGSHPPPKLKIAVLGAAGGIGQPLSLLLKHSTVLTDLSLYDIAHAPGVAVDLSHIETRVNVKGYMGSHALPECLDDCDIVVIPAGMPRKPGMTRDDLFKTNATIAYDLSHAIATTCPNAVVAFITNPVNSIVPIAAEVMKKRGCFSPTRLFGVTTLDVVRANTFIGELKRQDPAHIYCPVIGGHSGVTIIPLLSQVRPRMTFHAEEIAKLTERIQEAGTEVVKAKEGAGSATLSMAYAAARFCYSMMRAMRGETNVLECAYIKTDAQEVPYFASQVYLGANGMEKNLGIGTLNAYEKQLLKNALPELQKNIEAGEKFAKDKLNE